MRLFVSSVAKITRWAALLAVFLPAFAFALTIVAPKNPAPGTSVAPYTQVDGSNITFSWANVNGAASYDLVINEASSNNQILKATTTLTNYSWKLPAAGIYKWKVRACSASSVCSIYSSVIGIQTKPLTLAAFAVNCDATTINEGGKSNCTATATLSDSSTLNVTASAGLKLSPAVAYASINAQTGVINAQQVSADKTVTIVGSYAFNGGVAKTASTTVVIKDVPTLTGFQVTCLAAEISETNSNTCTATASLSNGVIGIDVTKATQWSLSSSQYASIDSGKLSTTQVPSDQVVSVVGSYSYNGAAAVLSTKKVTIKNTVAALVLSSDGRGTGKVLCNNTGCSGTYAIGTAVTLDAVDGADSTFKRWTVSGCAPALRKCKVTLANDKSGQVTFDRNDTVAFTRMREDVPHLGIHVFSIKPWELVGGADSQTVQNYPYVYKDAVALFSNYPGKIKATANLIKESLRAQNHGFQVLTNAVPLAGKSRGYQLAVQIEFTLNQFILFGQQFALERLKSVIDEWQQEGFAVHLLLAANIGPAAELKGDSRGSPLVWNQINWSALKENKDFFYGEEFIPYRPCLNAIEGQQTCPYDAIVRGFIKPTIDYLVSSKTAQRLAVIYIFNEFDYSGPKDPSVPPASLKELLDGKNSSQEPSIGNWKSRWLGRSEICGGLTAENCRAQSLVNTTKRALLVARSASNGQVPIGVKFIDFSSYSAFSTLERKKDILNDTILAAPSKTDLGVSGVIGVDCYWHREKAIFDLPRKWMKEADRIAAFENQEQCLGQLSRTLEGVVDSAKLSNLASGHLEVAEYGVACDDPSIPAPSNGASTRPDDASKLYQAWSARGARGFNLFALNAGKGSCHRILLDRNSGTFPYPGDGQGKLFGVLQQIRDIAPQSLSAK